MITNPSAIFEIYPRTFTVEQNLPGHGRHNGHTGAVYKHSQSAIVPKPLSETAYRLRTIHHRTALEVTVGFKHRLVLGNVLHDFKMLYSMWCLPMSDWVAFYVVAVHRPSNNALKRNTR